MEMLMPIILIIVITLVLLYLVGKAKMRKEQKATNAEVKAAQDAVTEKALELKKRADAYVYTDVQKQRLEALDKFGDRDYLYPQVDDLEEIHAIDNVLEDEWSESDDLGFSRKNWDRSRFNKVLPSGLLMILDCGYFVNFESCYRKVGQGEYIGIFEDEVLPSPAMKDKYNMIPMSREEFVKTYSIVSDGYLAKEHETSTVYVQNKQKSVVGGAVKGAIVAGGVGAVVGAITTADKNNHRGGHHVTYQTGEGHYFGTKSVKVKGICYDNQSGKGIDFAFEPNKFWVHDALLERFLLNEVITPDFITHHARAKGLEPVYRGAYRYTMQEFYQFKERYREPRSKVRLSDDFVDFINKVMADNGKQPKLRTGSIVVYKTEVGSIFDEEDGKFYEEGEIYVSIKTFEKHGKGVPPTRILYPKEIEFHFNDGGVDSIVLIVSDKPTEAIEKLLSSGDLRIIQY